MHERMRAGAYTLPALAALLAVAVIGLGVLTGTPEAAAQTPTPSATATPPARPARPTPTDAQVLAVEQQLLCPLCVNERLDVCVLAICNDMKQIIRERLAAGAPPDEIILFFETRYGPKVRAALPREGFNLVLFGWVGGAILLTAVAAEYALYSLRRDSRRRTRAAASPASAASMPAPSSDDRWVDELRDEARDGAADNGDTASSRGPR